MPGAQRVLMPPNQVHDMAGKDMAAQAAQGKSAEDARTFGVPGIFDNARDGLVLVRFPEAKVVLFNLAASEILERRPEAVLGKPLGDLLHDPDVLRRAQASAQEAVGEWPGHSQVSLVTHAGATGGLGDLEVNFCRVEDVGRGGPLVLLVVRRGPLWELAAMARKGAKAQTRVNEMERKAKDLALFFGEAAHEFNTPLTVVLLQSKLLHHALGQLSPVQERALARIDANVHRLMLLSQDLMDLARADAGRLLLNLEEMDLADAAGREVGNFHDLARERGVDLQWVAPPRPARIKGDARRLRQVLANFLNNALKFTPSGGRVQVRLEESDATAWVVVQDSGRGMAKEDVARLFQPFVRIPSPELPKKPGTGLGLYLSKRIVEAHGGTATAASEGPGQGMEFRFGVPLIAAAPKARKASRPARARSRTHASRGTSRGAAPVPAEVRAPKRKVRGM